MSDPSGGYPPHEPGEPAAAGEDQTQIADGGETVADGAYVRDTAPPTVFSDGPGEPEVGGPGGPGGFGGPPLGHPEPSRPKGLIALMAILALLLMISLVANVVLLMTRKSTPATTMAPTTTTILPSFSPSPSLSPTVSPSPSKTATGTPTGVGSAKDAAEKLYAARKANSKTQAKAVASQAAIDQIWAKPAGAYKLNGCESDPDDPSNPDKTACTFTQPGGQMTMSAVAQGGKWSIASVTYKPTGTP